MRKAFLFFFLFSIAYSGKSFSQNPAADSVLKPLLYRHGVYGEVLGNGLYGSLNYERFFRTPIGNDLAAFRVGAMIWPESQTAIVPLELFWLSDKWRIAKGSLRGEFGMGVTFVRSEYIEWQSRGLYANMSMFPTLRGSFRWQLQDKRLFVKAGASVVIVSYPGYVRLLILPLPSLGVGYSFGNKLTQ